MIKEIFIRLFVFSCSSFELRTLLLLLVRGRLFLCGGYERRKELLFLKWLYEKCVSLKLAAARPAAGSIIYLGKNCSYASKPGHLFRTAYVRQSMWFFL